MGSCKIKINILLFQERGTRVQSQSNQNNPNSKSVNYTVPVTKIHSWFMCSLKGLSQFFNSSLCSPHRLSPRLRSAPLHPFCCSWQFPIVLASSKCWGPLLHFTHILCWAFFRHPTQCQTSSAVCDLCMPTKLVPPWWFLPYQVQLPVSGSTLSTSGTQCVLTLRKHFSGFTSLSWSLFNHCWLLSSS